MDRRAQIWREIETKKGRVEALKITSSPVFEPATVTFGQLTVIAGLHGAGKSYSFSLIDEALPGWQARWNMPPHGPREVVSLVGEYELLLAGGDVERVSLPTDDNYGHHSPLRTAQLSSTLLDTHMVVGELAGFDSNVNWGKLPDDYLQVPSAIRRALSQVVGHDYEFLEVAIVEAEGFWFPMFRGRRDGVDVTTWTMSRSEYWVSYILWVLHSSTPADIVLVDEPETSLSPPGHRAFIDEIARLTMASGCQTIIATHSEEMIRRVPSALLRVITRNDLRSRFSTVTDVETLLRSLHRTPSPVTKIVLTEDETARTMVIAMLRRFAPARLASTDVVIAGGSGEVVAGVRALRRSSHIAVVGVLDGDAAPTRGEVARVWRLPGGAPEQEIAAAVIADIDNVSQALNVHPSELLSALVAARLSEHQRFFDSIANTVATHDTRAVREILAAAWAASDPNKADLKSLVRLISDAE